MRLASSTDKWGLALVSHSTPVSLFPFQSHFPIPLQSLFPFHLQSHSCCSSLPHWQSSPIPLSHPRLPHWQSTLWSPVGGGHHYHPTVKQSCEEPLQDHGVSYVRHLELIKTQQMCFVSNHPGNGANWIVCMGLVLPGRARGELLFELVNTWKRKTTFCTTATSMHILSLTHPSPSYLPLRVPLFHPSPSLTPSFASLPPLSFTLSPSPPLTIMNIQHKGIEMDSLLLVNPS